MDSNSVILARILEIRATKTKSINAFAEMLNMPQATVSNYILGKRKISLEFVVAILSSFGDISPDWLLLGVGPMLRSNDKENILSNQYVTKANNVTQSGSINESTDSATIQQLVEQNKMLLDMLQSQLKK